MCAKSVWRQLFEATAVKSRISLSYIFKDYCTSGKVITVIVFENIADEVGKNILKHNFFSIFSLFAFGLSAMLTPKVMNLIFDGVPSPDSNNTLHNLNTDITSTIPTPSNNGKNPGAVPKRGVWFVQTGFLHNKTQNTNTN
jgi:hypothetical protein